MYFAILFILFGRVFTKIASKPTSSIYCLSQLIVHKRDLISSGKSFFSKMHDVRQVMKFDNESISNETIILIWINC